MINDDGLMQSDLLHVFFDVETGSDYPDGDEWFIVDMLFPYDMKLPDSLKGTDYFKNIDRFAGETGSCAHLASFLRKKKRRWAAWGCRKAKSERS